MNRTTAVLLAGLLALWSISGIAADAGLTVVNPWARPAAQGQVGVVYLTVTDTGAPDRLVGVRTPVSDDAQLHESMQDNGVMKMRPVAGVPVAPGQPLVLAPGGYHIMLINLKQPLKQGDTVPVTLVFEKAGAVSANAAVQREAPH
jgi:periplasmic copper chaperone A